MILRALTLAALIAVCAAAVIGVLVLVALALGAVLNFAQSLEAWQRGAIVAAGLACVLVVVMEIRYER